MPTSFAARIELSQHSMLIHNQVGLYRIDRLVEIALHRRSWSADDGDVTSTTSMGLKEFEYPLRLRLAADNNHVRGH